MNLRKQIENILQQDAGTLPSVMAEQLEVPELTIIRHLPDNMATELPASQFEAVLQHVKQWGKVTTIIEVAGCIFEIKCPFPNGSNKFGYYNLMSEDNPFQGHLKPENVHAIALISKLFHGTITHSISFFDHNGRGIFKIYLGRNADRSFIAGQEQQFEWLKKHIKTNEE